MIDGLKPYSDMKESGVPWLGKVPKHWDVSRAKTCFREADDRSATGDEELLSVSHITGVTPRSQKNITMFLAESNVGHKRCQPNDIVVNTMWAWMAALGVARHRGIVSPSYAVYRPLRNNGLLPDYVDRVLRTPEYASEYLRVSTGINTSRLRLYPEQFLRIPLLRPLPDEQDLILRFLDDADRRIRHYIRTKQKLIALLQEQKQAIIHRAVTRGLDPNVRLRPSGVYWLGEVPEHWEVVRLKAVLLRPIRNGLFKKKEFFGTGVPLVNVADVYRGDFTIDTASLERVQATPSEVLTYSAKPGDLFFVRSSLKLEGTGRCAVMRESQTDSVFECHLVQARPDPQRTSAWFLALQLNSSLMKHYFISKANVVTMATVSQDVFASCPVVLPPLAEQMQIVKWSAEATADVESTIGTTTREIALLREYRTRLIADVVTGKLDVREAAARLPDEPDEGEAEAMEDKSEPAEVAEDESAAAGQTEA